jgi:hypothetical protein
MFILSRLVDVFFSPFEIIHDLQPMPFHSPINKPKMHAQYSEAVDHGSYRDDGLSNGIPLRVHRKQHLEIQGSMRAQHDWSTLVSPIDGYYGGLGDRFNFVSVTIPNCLPERLEVVSYANEFAFLYDGMFN